MIIRDLGVRHARKALAATPLRQACLRAFSTQPTAPDLTTTSSPPSPPNAAAAQPPAVFTAHARGTRRRKAAPDHTVENFLLSRQLRARTGQLGARVEKRYRPWEVFAHPPGPKDVTLELLMASQAHMGHHASLWNPANARYIYGVRQGIHIISLEQTAAHLRRAAHVVEEVAYRGGLILFVGNRPGQTQIVTQAARLAKACHLFTKWTPGSITNSEVILAGMPMQILDENDDPVLGFERHLTERRPLVPDLVVCLNPLENFVLLQECSLVNVPTIGVIDTDAEPTWVTYAIPANDDSFRCLAVIGSVLGCAGQAGHKRRIEDAKRGVVAWNTPLDVIKFMEIEAKHAYEEAKKNSEEQSEGQDLLSKERAGFNISRFDDQEDDTKSMLNLN
ncbi:ribosomal protein S2 [Jackrogersella minutella]|nr:ribosomal protein S2 [Jackrogersella minutella]